MNDNNQEDLEYNNHQEDLEYNDNNQEDLEYNDNNFIPIKDHISDKYR
jgi:hypothetical protein